MNKITDQNVQKQIQKIRRIAKEKDAVIAAHNYQRDEVQEAADIVGDSLALANYCANAAQKTIVFCGVHFMAESASIISPEKTVLLPEADAGCPMADMAEAFDVRQMKKDYPDAAVVCYINTSAAVKAECDICCTSSNAIKVVSSLPQKRIIFLPDMNLGTFVKDKLPEKEIILWQGYCITHHRIAKEDVIAAKEAHPDAVLLVHPECRPEVTRLADFVGSTKQIIDFAKQNNRMKFIIGTEMGVLHKLKRDNPGKTFYMLSKGMVCPNMKKTSLNSIENALLYNRYKIEVQEEIRNKAYKCLVRMLEIKA